MTTTTGTLAAPERHTYAVSGRAFYLVPCYRCAVVLNSGHHYPEVDGAPSPFALALAAEHNDAHHPAEALALEVVAP